MRNVARKMVAVVALGVFAAACSERPTEPGSLGSPDFAKGGAAACPTPADVVVTDEASLLAALAAANSGDVIGVDGFFEVTVDVLITTDHLTLTCATAGSGLAAQAGARVNRLLSALADGVVVERLVLDGSETDFTPYIAANVDVVRFSHNTVTCGLSCAALTGATNAVITDNYFVAAGPLSGVHIQSTATNPIDGTRVLRNTVITTAPSTGPVDDCPRCFRSWGGIRVHGGVHRGKDVVVSDNVVIGPWANSLAPADISDGRFERNRLEGAANYGIGTSLNAFKGRSTLDNVFRNNRISGVGVAGVFATSACGNVFLGNNLQGNADNTGAIFEEETGNNTLVGNATIVIDNGAFDCDGDGAVDPNIITGAGQVLSGVNLGRIVSEAASSRKGGDIH